MHTVAAVVRPADGSVHVGVNLYHFLGGPCAELVALGAARAHGATEITHIVAVGDRGRGVLNPCGRDRQILSDYHPNVRVVVTDRGELVTVSVADLLPLAYDAVAAQD
ncbi:cytidine deaminase family protein [Curtobacterium sp. 20TX0008]|uniref:cytidine deaminase family protein n=1 Tax=Curtobacterium sp. 20TX0008 TaxID=3022018 RepID=UPI00232B8B3D|nr:cytidine deaminase [Curtobacterium sp. 20TX0008]MDB6425901.1 cytidine deaminase [Curtobacterium sp. 20TX0008]